MSNEFKCELCGEPMPEGEEMFKFHGYSGKCPKPPLNSPAPLSDWQKMEQQLADCQKQLDYHKETIQEWVKANDKREKQIVKLRYYIRGIQAVAESSIKTHGYDKQHMQNISACKKALDATIQSEEY